MNLLLLPKPKPSVGEPELSLLSPANQLEYENPGQHDLFGFFPDLTLLKTKKHGQTDRQPNELINLSELDDKRFSRGMFDLMIDDLKSASSPPVTNQDAQRRQNIATRLQDATGQTQALQAVGSSIDVLIGQNQQLISVMTAQAKASAIQKQTGEATAKQQIYNSAEYQQKLREAARQRY